MAVFFFDIVTMMTPRCGYKQFVALRLGGVI
jgi:hypothetical protein